MNGLPYYKAYPRDFLEGTVGMSLELKGAYRLILDLIYMHGGRLPVDHRYIAAHLGCSHRKASSLLSTLVEGGKIECDGDLYSNYRADNELISSRYFQDKQKINRSRPNKINKLQSPNGHHTESEPESDILDLDPTNSAHTLERPSAGEAENSPAADPDDPFFFEVLEVVLSSRSAAQNRLGTARDRAEVARWLKLPHVGRREVILILRDCLSRFASGTGKIKTLRYFAKAMQDFSGEQIARQLTPSTVKPPPTPTIAPPAKPALVDMSKFDDFGRRLA